MNEELKEELTRMIGWLTIKHIDADAIINKICRLVEQNFVPKSEYNKELLRTVHIVEEFETRMEQLKAENEKLRSAMPFAEYLDNKVEQARKDERTRTKKAIEGVLFKRFMNDNIEFHNLLATELSKEFNEAIEPQPSVIYL